jgi:GNAT superfamily N-acetyltransferase
VSVTVALVDALAQRCFRNFATLPNARVIDDGAIVGVMTEVPITFFNGIATSQLDRDEVPRVIETFRANAQPFRWWISPSAQPQDLATILKEHGIQHRFDSAGMVADLSSMPDVTTPDELTIERVTRLDDWIDVFVIGFERHPEERSIWLDAYAQLRNWLHYVGYVNGVAVATTSALLDGDLAGIYHVVTLPESRGRGIGAAMTHAAMRDARASGARHAVLQASAMGEGVYRSVGFESVCRLSLFDWRPE